MHRLPLLAPLVALAMLTPVTHAQSCDGQWTVYGTIDNDGVFDSVPEGSVYSLVVEIPPNTPGSSLGGVVNYDVGFASFSVAGYTATDFSATISVRGSSDTVYITLNGPEANLGSLEYTNNEDSGDVGTIQILLIGASTSTDPVLTDALPITLDPALFSTRVANIIVPGASSPSGGVDIVSIDRPISAEFNGDGIPDNGDINAFIGYYLSSDLFADINQDGYLDNGDIALFIFAFLYGC